MILAKVEPGYRALHRIADRLTPAMRRAFLRAVEDLRTRIDPTRLRELLERGDQGDLGAFWRAFEQEVDLRGPIRDAVLESANRFSVGGRFDLTNPQAVREIDTRAGLLIREITTESRTAIRTVLHVGFTEGRTVPQMARAIRDAVGLTSRSAAAVERFRQAQLQAGVASGLVERRATAYADRLLRDRATNIARTETIGAASAGQRLAWLEAQQQGLLPADQQRVFIVTPDDRLCLEICAPMDGQVRGLNEPFTTGEGFHIMHPPAHPQCRCAVGLTSGEEE